MLKLLQFFIKNHIFFVFLVLEIVALSLTVQKRSFHRSVFTNSSNAIAGKVWETYHGMRSYFNLRDANEQLLNENVKLRSILRQVKEVQAIKSTDTIADSIYQQRYTFRKAEVIHNSFNKRNNYLTLAVGRLEGVSEGVAVVGPHGVVGIIDQVTDHFASVISVLNKDSRISARIASSSYFGSLTWDGRDYRKAQVQDIPREAEFQLGDTLVTSSYSSILPEGIPIGVISDFELKPEDNFFKIEVELSTNFANLSYVYVVENLLKYELEALEENREDER